MSLLQLLQLQVAVLSLGTLYAWYQFYLVIKKKCDTCSVSLEENPFKSKCFVGALFFSAALLIAVITLLQV